MKAILERISSVCGLLDTDGITVHTMNGDYQRDHIKFSQEAADFVRHVRRQNPARHLMAPVEVSYQTYRLHIDAAALQSSHCSGQDLTKH